VPLSFVITEEQVIEVETKDTHHDTMIRLL